MSLLQVIAIVSIAGLLQDSILLVVGFVFVLLVLVVLYFSTVILNRRWFARAIFVCLGLLFFYLIFLFFHHRPLDRRPRIAISPFTVADSSPELAWPAWAIPKVTTDIIRSSVGDAFYVSTLESAARAVQADSLESTDYIAAFSRRVDLSFTVFGRVQNLGGSWRVNWGVWDSQAGKVVVDTSRTFSEPELLEMCVEVGSSILASLSQPMKIRPLSNEMTPSLAKAMALSDLMLQQKQFDRALQFKRDAASSMALTQLGKVYLERGKHRRYMGLSAKEDFYSGREVVQRALTQDSTLIAHTVLAELEILRGEWSNAEHHLRRALHLDPVHPRTLVLMAQLHPSRYRDLGFRHEEDLYRRAIFYDSCCLEARIALAAYYQDRGQSTRALRVLEDVLSINPHSVEGLMAIGKIYIARGDFATIVDTFERILQIDPDHADAYYNLGIVYYHSKNRDAARRLFKKAIALNDHLDSHLYLGLIARESGEYQLAIDRFRQRVRRKRGPNDAYAELARQNLYELTHSDEVTQQN